MIPKTRQAHTDARLIRCDHCRRQHSVFGANVSTPMDIRRVAAKSGWMNEGESDICPDCVKTLASQE